MRYLLRIGWLPLFLLIEISAFSQRPQFSLATDVGVLRSFKKQQQFWTIGQTVAGHFHFTPRDGAYAWITYYALGRTKNEITAIAKSQATTPAQITYINRAGLSFRQLSFGWHHYFKGDYRAEKGWNMYGNAGFGLMFGHVENTPLVDVDTAFYSVQVYPGEGNFKRLTVDLGIGFEKPVGGDCFLYAEARTFVPITNYPSNFLFINGYSPLTASAQIGLRILFD